MRHRCARPGHRRHADRPRSAGRTTRPRTVRDESKPGTGITFAPPLDRAARGRRDHPRRRHRHHAQLRRSRVAHANNAAIGKSGLTVTAGQDALQPVGDDGRAAARRRGRRRTWPSRTSRSPNKDVIAVDQDTLGIQATRCRTANGQWMLTAPLANGDTAVALFNANATDWLAASSDFASLGLDPAQKYLPRTCGPRTIGDGHRTSPSPTSPRTRRRCCGSRRAPPTITVPASVAANVTGRQRRRGQLPATAKDAFDGALTPTCSSRRRDVPDRPDDGHLHGDRRRRAARPRARSWSRDPPEHPLARRRHRAGDALADARRARRRSRRSPRAWRRTTRPPRRPTSSRPRVTRRSRSPTRPRSRPATWSTATFSLPSALGGWRRRRPTAGAGLQRPGHGHLHAAHRRDRRAPHGRVQQDPDVHPVHDEPVVHVASPRWGCAPSVTRCRRGSSSLAS